MTFKDKGIVLKENFVGESDKILTVLFYEHGKLSISVRGARKPKSKLASVSQPFCLGEFVVFKGNGFLSLTQGNALDNFYALVKDYDMYCYASLFLEMADKLIFPEMPSKDILLLTVKSLKTMVKGKIPPKLVASVFQLKFMQAEGLFPEISHCVYCGKRELDELFFSVDGIICGKCMKEAKSRNIIHKYKNLTETARYAVSYILEAEISNVFSFRLSDSEIDILYNAISFFVRNHVDIKFKSTEALNFTKT